MLSPQTKGMKTMALPYVWHALRFIKMWTNDTEHRDFFFIFVLKLFRIATVVASRTIALTMARITHPSKNFCLFFFFLFIHVTFQWNLYIPFKQLRKRCLWKYNANAQSNDRVSVALEPPIQNASISWWCHVSVYRNFCSMFLLAPCLLLFRVLFVSILCVFLYFTRNLFSFLCMRHAIITSHQCE